MARQFMANEIVQVAAAIFRAEFIGAVEAAGVTLR
jgi:hypothetical protein